MFFCVILKCAKNCIFFVKMGFQCLLGLAAGMIYYYPLQHSLNYTNLDTPIVNLFCMSIVEFFGLA